jgi:hypothetical protein
MIHLHIKFHMQSPSGSFITVTKPRGNIDFMQAPFCITVYKNYFHKQCTFFEDLLPYLSLLSNTNVTLISQVHVSDMLFIEVD